MLAMNHGDSLRVERSKDAPIGGAIATSSSDDIGADTTSAMIRQSSKKEYIQGYKDVPSLAAIRDRVRGMSLSSPSAPNLTGSRSAPPPPPVDGSIEKCEAEVEKEEGGKAKDEETLSPPTTASSEESVEEKKNLEHPLQHAWSVRVTQIGSRNFCSR
jgi:translation initiation factor 4E